MTIRSVWQDVRYGTRKLLKTRSFNLVAILALALGIGANTAIFSVVNTILLRPPPYQDPERLVMVWEANTKRGLGQIPTSFPNFNDLKTINNVFEDIAAFADRKLNLTGGDEPEQVRGLYVSPNAMSLLGVKPTYGRTFLAEEGKPGANHVLILSYGLWQRRFGASLNAIGRQVELNGESYLVVGVMPPDFEFPPTFTATIASSKLTIPNADLWIPLTTDVLPDVRGVRGLLMIGRLKSNVTMGQARAEMDIIAKRLEKEYPGPNEGMEVSLIPLRTQITGDIQLPLLILLAATGFVLLIACADVANLLLARTIVRREEIAIRIALGASRFRLIRQMLTESALLGLVSSLLGLLFAYWCVRQLVAFSPTSISRVKEVSIDKWALLFTLVVSLLTAFIFGLAPATYASKSDLNQTLKEGSRSSTEGSRQSRFHNVLVISEVALALILSIAAGLMINSFLRLQNVNPGFNPRNVITLELQLPQPKYPQAQQRIIFQQQLIQHIEAVPGVQYAGTVNNIPFGGSESHNTYSIEGRDFSNHSERLQAYTRIVSPKYFQVMDIIIHKGRQFTDEDNLDSSRVALINETAARRLWGDEDPIGKRIKLGSPESNNSWLSIIGVVGSISHTSLGVTSQPEVYVPFRQNPGPTITLVARATSDPKSVAAAIRQEVAALDRSLPFTNIRYMEDLISNSVAQPRLYTFLLGLFAALALLLAAAGIYGVLSYSVGQRTHEIGVRMALGAQQRDIFKLIVGHTAVLIFIGLGVGLAISLALSRVMSSLLFGVTPNDSLTFVLISLLLLVVGLLASYIPARRATKVNPLIALRNE